MDWWSKRTEPSTHALRVHGRPSVTEISPTLLIGEYLRPDDIAWLKAKFGVSAIQNLQDDEDLALNGLRERDLAEAARESGAGERVYLHCNAGLNRAPTLAIAYLRAHGVMSLDEACAHVKARRACGPFMTILEDYFGPRHHKPGK
jgi:hypothetical protein